MQSTHTRTSGSAAAATRCATWHAVRGSESGNRAGTELGAVGTVGILLGQD